MLSITFQLLAIPYLWIILEGCLTYIILSSLILERVLNNLIKSIYNHVLKGKRVWEYIIKYLFISWAKVQSHY
jgi:hypothetical protein